MKKTLLRVTLLSLFFPILQVGAQEQTQAPEVVDLAVEDKQAEQPASTNEETVQASKEVPEDAYAYVEERAREYSPMGIILSGGPESVTGLKAGSETLAAPEYVFDLGVPVLGICYGMQTMAKQLGGEVEGSDKSEFGYARVEVISDSALISELRDGITTNPYLDV